MMGLGIKSLRAYVFIGALAAFICTTGLAGDVSACDEPPPSVLVTDTDAPDCLGLEDGEWGPITVTNGCEEPLTLTNVAHVRQRAEAVLFEDARFTLEPGASAQVDAVFRGNLGWTMEDGSEGTIELRYVSNDDGGCGIYCAFAGVESRGPQSVWPLVLLICLGGWRRKARETRPTG
jgi:hypothetical protein